MEAALAEPHQPVTGYFLNVLSYLNLLRDRGQPLPGYPTNDPAALKVWQAEAAVHRDALKAIERTYLAQLGSAVKLKQGRAAAITIETLTQKQTCNSDSDDQATRDERATLLAKVFFDLPLEHQRSLIEYSWDSISSQALLPVLRQLYEHPPDLNERPQPFPEVALRRIYQLAPAEGRQLILDQMRRPELRIGISVLGLLPDKELPDLEETIVGNALKRPDETSIALVARYVSAASFPRLRQGLEDRIGKIGCGEQADLISYFLRADESFGMAMIRKAIASRKMTRCYVDALNDITVASPELEALAAQLLDDRDPEVAYSAITFLCRHGSVTNRAKIKATIKRVIDGWRDPKIDPEAYDKRKGYYPGFFAESLLMVYATAIPWVTSREELQELADLCLTAQCRQQVKPRDLLAKTEIRYFYSEGTHHETNFAVGEYEGLSLSLLKQKVLQFPKGTRFTWSRSNASKEIDEQTFAELKTYLKEQGSELVRAERNAQC
jgi:hypothetical protein